MSTNNNKVIIFKNTNDLLFVYSANTEQEKDNAVKEYYGDLLEYEEFPEIFENKLTKLKIMFGIYYQFW